MIYKIGDKFSSINERTGVAVPNEIEDIKYKMKRPIGSKQYLNDDELRSLMDTHKVFTGSLSKKEIEIRAIELKYGISLKEEDK